MIGKWIQKIKKNKRRIGVGALALFLAGVMGVNLLQNSTSTVYAAESQTVVDPDTTDEWTDYIAPGGTVSTQNVGRIWTDKSVTNQNYTFTGSDNLPSINKGDSDFIVALSALSSTSNLKTMVRTSVPLDIVLVLDMSGSMDDYFGSGGNRQSRISALKTAVNNFIDATASINDNIENPDERHEISIVKFAGNKSNSVGDDKYWEFFSTYNYSQVVTNLASYTSSNANSLKRTVNELDPAGGTQADYGMELAEAQLNSHGRENAQQVVVFFTDGEPGDGSYFNQNVANGAVQASRNIKQKEDAALVYTVGIFDGASSTNMNSNANQFMQAVSSNYPNATAYNNRGERDPDGDYYKTAQDSDELNNIFEDISDEIQQGVGSGSPIEETTSQGNTEPGSLTFTDTLGAYMHVTGIGDGEDKMQIAYADKVFTSSSKTTSGNIDTYHFEGEVAGNTVYGAANLSDLTVTVERSDDLVTGDIVTVTIPASLIPMRHYDVDTNNPSMTVTSAYPVRLFYGVSVKEEAKKAMNDSSSDVYNEIAKTNLSDDKKTIDFYSNLYTTGNGNTTADFTPNIGNKFYYYTDDTELYVDENCATRATTRNIARYDTLYYSDPYWTQGNGTVTESNKGNSISINGLDWSAITYDQNGNAYIPGHTQRKDRPNTLNSNKSENKTGTATTVLSPEWTGDNSVTQHLGNNGKISYPAAGQLEIKKGVDWGNASDETKQNQNNFTFTVELTDENDEELIGEFPYDIYDENSDQPVEVDPQTTIQSGETITLKAGQRAVISNLPSGAKYKVTEEEANENGFTTTDTSSEETNDPNDGMVIGAIVAGSQQSVSFQNDYSADKPVLLSTEGTIQVKKVLDGREWRDDDEFTFSITASNEDAAPLPQENKVTITKDDEKNDFTKAFGDIEFKKSGEYRYSINEIQGNIVGIDYSTALYRVIVNVVDGGNGQLKIDSIKLDRMATDDGEDLSKNPQPIDPVDKAYTATYTNKYIMDGTGRANIAGTKTYYDHSGQNPIDGSKFLFKLNALGGYKTADGMSGDTYPIEAENVPMPRDEEGNIVSETGNVVNDFTFETIYFDGNDVGNTYVYEVTEIPGSEANMSYDQTVYTVTIEVTEDTSEDPEHTGHAHINTSVSYKKTLNGVTEDTGSISFVNNYDPTEVTLGQDGAASIIGTKTLTGRNMTDQDVFNFKLTPSGNVTNTAINEGIITGIDSNGLTTTVTGPVDKGVAKEFSFGNITFKKPGTYQFLMDETDSGISNGITYDESTCVVTVEIGLDKGSGKLVVSNIGYANNDNNFVNEYKATVNYGAKGGINVTKQMLDRPMNANEFAFSITGIDSSNVTAKDATAKLAETDIAFANTASAQDQTITMSKLQNLTFNQDDAGKTFSYIVDELEPGKDPAPAVTYDQTQYQVDIEVVDNGNGTMYTVTTVTKIKDSNGQGSTEIIVDHQNSSDEGYTAPTFGFVNDYDPNSTTVGEDGEYQLKVTKKVTGAPNSDDFTFSATFNEEASTGSINDVEGLTNGSTTATITEDFNDGDSKSVDFGTLTFKAPGTYVFTVKEDTTTDKAGWTYDNYPRNIEIVVTDLNENNQYDGNLYIDSVTNNGLVELENRYKPTEVIIGGDGAQQQIVVQKSVTGADTDVDFTFQLEPIVDINDEEDVAKWEDAVEPVEDNFDGSVVITDRITTAESKSATFGGIKFKKEGTFEFNVYELGAAEFNAGSERKGWTYDEHKSKVTINVTDTDFDGYLEASISYDNTDATTDSDKAVDTAAAFTNKYSTTPVELKKDTESGIGVQKEVVGAPNSDDFTFSATFNTDASTGSIDDIEGLTNGSTTATITEDFNDGDSKSVDFDTLTFKAPGTYVFTVKEDTTTDKAGWTYDATQKQIVVTVTDNTEGVLKASVEGNDPLFTNKYQPSAVIVGDDEADLQVTKKVTGAPAIEEFSFTLKVDSSMKDKVDGLDQNGEINKTTNTLMQGNQTETVDFGDLTFKETGTYQFTVTETTTTNEKGWSYDNSAKTITVKVTDEGFDGQLDATTVIDGEDTNNPTINNKYDAESITTGTDTLANPQVTKKVTGAPATEEFEFVLKLTSENAEHVEGLGENNQITKPTTSLKGKDPEATETVDFGQITFKEEGIYTFAVKETTTTDKDGWTYDNAERVITYTVTDTDHDGFLEATTNVEENGEIKDTNNPTITNKYEAGSATLSGEDSLKVTKKVTGAPAIEEFQFTLALTEGDASGVIGLGENNQITLSTDEMTGENAQTTDTVNFGELTFSKIGRYVFTVKEDTTTNKLGWIYDNSSKTITVDVTDDGFDGQLDATTFIDGEDTNNPTVTNKYEPNSITTGTETLGNPQVTKVVEGSMATEEFEFTLELTSENAEFVEGLDENNQITLSTDQMTGENAQTTDTVDFGQLTFSKVGDYVFTVTENTQATVGGWTYDNSPKTITYHVTDDGYDGQLDATTVIDGKDTNNPTVTNKYEAAEFVGIPTDFTLTKVFEGKEWSTEDVFEFTLTAGDNTADVDTPMPANTTVQVNAPTEKDGKTAKFNFGSIPYDTVGEYHYTVSEVEGTNVGIDYSKNVAEITVTVTDNKQGGLVASANVVKGTFRNTYSSELDYVGKGGIKLVKNLTGHDLADDQFTFTLKAEDEASRAKAGMENMSEDVFNTADTMDENGLSTSTIQLLPNMAEFTQEDVGKVYKYTVSETSEQQPGYTNDTTVYTIEISTSDDGAGTLTVTTHITGTDGTDVSYPYTQSKAKAETGVAQVVFNNTYTSSTQTEGYDGSVNLTGTKTLTNRPMVANEFNFQVIDNMGNKISTGSNTADGIVTFTPINYTNTQLIQDLANGIASKDGDTYTYVYDVQELDPEDEGTTIVAGEFSVTVEVTDNGDGKLTTNVIYPETGLAFENAYGQSANAELNIHGTKKLAENGTNHPDITGKFQFTITGSDGAPMPEQTTVTNDASGNINFGKIVYTMQNVFGDDGQQTILEEEPVVDQEMPIAEEQTTEDGTVSEDVVGLTEQVETYSEKREKTFTYTITESGSLPGVTNDSAKVINVKVIDNGDGTISVTSDTQGTFTFVNTYVPDPTDETSPTDSAVTIKKVLDGRTLKADEFSFTMMDENGNGVQATNAEDGSVVFPKLTFDKEGIYTYTISETNDNKGGVNYDTTTYKAIATVTDDTSGKLKVEWKVTDAQGKEINEITFNNKYTVQPTSLTLGATKVLEGRELADKEFLFVLSDEEGNVVEEAYNDKTGKVTFSDLTFDKSGTYNYTVTEKNTNAKGITYDESVYNIQVEVVDNEDGTLNMTTTTTKDGEVSSIVFKNKAEKDSVPEQPEKGDTSNTSTQTYAGLFTSLAVNAAALAGIATLLKKRNEKQ